MLENFVPKQSSEPSVELLTSHPDEWEYKVELIEAAPERILERLNSVGAKGWELVESTNLHTSKYERLYIFKRPVFHPSCKTPLKLP